jgi:hypothetical protein
VKPVKTGFFLKRCKDRGLEVKFEGDFYQENSSWQNRFTIDLQPLNYKKGKPGD